MRRRVFEHDPNPKAVSASINNLAILAKRQHRYDDAMRLYQEAIAEIDVSTRGQARCGMRFSSVSLSHAPPARTPTTRAWCLPRPSC